jgi:hypothetical protein
LDSDDQVKQIKELIKQDGNSKKVLMDLVLEENKRSGRVVKVVNPPFSRIARIIDSFKNSNIFTECPNFDENKYS